MKLSRLIQDFTYTIVSGNIDIEIEKVCINSKEVGKNSLFVCIRGANTDGHNYINDALKKGATALIVDREITPIKGVTVISVENSSQILSYVSRRFFSQPSDKLSLIGVTGTNGKSTVTSLLFQSYQLLNISSAVLGTIGNKINTKSYPSVNTTPNPLELQGLFSEMVSEDVKYVNMEVSSHGLELGRVNGCEFDFSIFTNLTQDHLDFHHNMENYRDAKAKLFSMTKENGYSIINVDDYYGEFYVSIATSNVLTYGIHKNSDIKASDIQLTSKGCSFGVTTPKGEFVCHTNLVGLFNVYNVLAVITTLFAQGFSLDIINNTVSNLVGVEGRMQTVENKEGVNVIVDYAHTPDALENVLNNIKEMASSKSKIYTVFGCGGERDRTKRPLMTSISKRLSDYSIITSDNPRHEDFTQIVDDMLSDLKDLENISIMVNRREAICSALRKATKGDIVLIAGKGHETYQIIGNDTLPFDDREVVKEYFLNN